MYFAKSQRGWRGITREKLLDLAQGTGLRLVSIDFTKPMKSDDGASGFDSQWVPVLAHRNQSETQLVCNWSGRMKTAFAPANAGVKLSAIASFSSRRSPSGPCHVHVQRAARNGGSVRIREYQPRPRPPNPCHEPQIRHRWHSGCGE